MAGFLAALAPIAGRLLSSGSLLKSAYGNGAMGLMNLGMDAIPLAMDIANNDVGLKSFSSFGGTMLGTKFGGRELNELGNSTYKKLERNAVDSYNQQSMRRPQLGLPTAGNAVTSSYGRPQQGVVPSFREINPNRDAWIDSNMSIAKDKMLNDSKYSRQGYNMAIGFGADASLYSLTSGMNKPKSSSGLEDASQGFNNSPVSRYMQMTGAL